MQSLSKSGLVCAATLLICAATAGAQQAPDRAEPAQAQAQAQAPAQSSAPAVMTVQGELLKLDQVAHTVAVKTATGEMLFTFNDQTKVAGGEARTIAALSTMSGSQVTVRYQKDGASSVATNIEVRPAAPKATEAPKASPDKPAAPPY